MRRRLPLPAATIECTCGNTHVSADGKIPVGWTARSGQAWCVDSTRAGIPTRQIQHGGSRKRRKAA